MLDLIPSSKTEKSEERPLGPVDHCQNVLKSMNFFQTRIMQKQNLDPNESFWINTLQGLIKGMELLCLEHMSEGLSWKDDGPDAKGVFESCPLGSEAASVAAKALEILETMEQRGVLPDAIDDNDEWKPDLYDQVAEEAARLGKQGHVFVAVSAETMLRKQIEKLEKINARNKVHIEEDRKKMKEMQKEIQQLYARPTGTDVKLQEEFKTLKIAFEKQKKEHEKYVKDLERNLESSVLMKIEQLRAEKEELKKVKDMEIEEKTKELEEIKVLKEEWDAIHKKEIEELKAHHEAKDQHIEILKSESEHMKKTKEEAIEAAKTETERLKQEKEKELEKMRQEQLMHKKTLQHVVGKYASERRSSTTVETRLENRRASVATVSGGVMSAAKLASRLAKRRSTANLTEKDPEDPLESTTKTV